MCYERGRKPPKPPKTSRFDKDSRKYEKHLEPREDIEGSDVAPVKIASDRDLKDRPTSRDVLPAPETPGKANPSNKEHFQESLETKNVKKDAIETKPLFATVVDKRLSVPERHTPLNMTDSRQASVLWTVPSTSSQTAEQIESPAKQSRPKQTWVQLITEAFQKADLRPLTAKQVCEKVQESHPWYANPKHIQGTILRRSVSASLSSCPNVHRRTVGGLDGGDSQSSICYMYCPPGMSENDVLTRIQNSDPKWWHDSFLKASGHRMPYRTTDAIWYCPKYVVFDNISAAYQIKPRKSHWKPWTELQSHRSISYRGGNYRVGDVVRLGPWETAQYGWIREIRACEDGQPSVLMFWFFFRDFVEGNRATSFNPEDWPADKDFVLSNCLNVFSPNAFSGRPDKTQLSRIDLESKVIIFLRRSSRIKDLGSDEIAWMFANGLHPAKFKSNAEYNPQGTVVIESPARRYRHPELFESVKSSIEGECLRLDGTRSLSPAKSRASEPSLATRRPSLLAHRPHEKTAKLSSSLQAEVGLRSASHISLNQTPDAAPWHHSSNQAGDLTVSQSREPGVETYSSIKDILLRKPPFGGWGSLRFPDTPKQLRLSERGQAQSRSVHEKQEADANTFTSTKKVGEPNHISTMRQLYGIPPLDNFVRCVHNDRLAYRDRMNVSASPEPNCLQDANPFAGTGLGNSRGFRGR